MPTMSSISRRDLVLSLPALLVAPHIAECGLRIADSWVDQSTVGGPQSAIRNPQSLRVRALNHMTLAVSDPKRSVDFYQGLFGMPIQARQGATTLLRIGAGPQFLALSGTGPNGTPSINHVCLTTDNFDADRALAALAKVGVT